MKKKISILILLAAVSAFAGISPVLMNSYTTNITATADSRIISIVNSGQTLAVLMTVTTNISSIVTNDYYVVTTAGSANVNGTYYVNGSYYTNSANATNLLVYSNQQWNFTGDQSVSYYLYASPFPSSGVKGAAAGLTYITNGGVGISPVPVVTYVGNTTNHTYTTNIVGGFVGNGSGLTNLQAGQLTGTIPSSSLPAGVVTNKTYLNVLDFGAYADGQTVRQKNGLLITAGSSTVIASNWVFTAADVGKNVEIVNYMTATNTWPGSNSLINVSTTIIAVNSATNITLGTNVPAITAQYHMDYGHNDTPVVQRMVDFITTNGGTGVIFVPNGYGKFLFLDDPWHTNAIANPGPNTVFYSQIVLPYWKAAGDNLVNIEFMGESPDLPRDTTMGSRMVCSRQPPTSALYGGGGSGSLPSLLDCAGHVINYKSSVTVIGACFSYTVSGFNNGGMSTTSIGFSHITLDTYYCAPYCPIDCSYMWETSFNSVSVGNNYPNKYENGVLGGSTGSGTPVALAGKYISAGIIFPANDNSIEQCYNGLQVDGYDIAEVSYECVRGDNLFGRSCNIAVLQLSAIHPSSYGRIFPWNPYYGIVFGYNQFQGGDNGHAVVSVDCLDMENGYAVPVYNPLGVGIGIVKGFCTNTKIVDASINASPLLEIIDLGNGYHSGITIGSRPSNSSTITPNPANNGLRFTLPNGSVLNVASYNTNGITLSGWSAQTLAYSTNSAGLTNSFLFNENGNLYSNVFGNLVLSKNYQVYTNLNSVVPGSWSMNFAPSANGCGYLANSSGTPFAFGTNDVTFSFFAHPNYATNNAYGFVYLMDTLNVGGTQTSATSMQLTMQSYGSGAANTLQLRFGNTVAFTTTNTVNFNQWNHIIVERLNGVWSIWINGAQDVQYTNSTYSDAGAGLVFGNQSSATWYPTTAYSGLIDKIQIWNRGLSPTEIGSLQLSGVPLTVNGLLSGNATTATTATNDPAGNNIATFYQPSSAALTNLSSTNYVALNYTGGTNVLVDFSLGSNFILAATNNAYFIPTNITSLPNGGGSILCTNNATGGWSFDYTKFTWPSAQVLTMTTNAGAWNLISVKRGPSAVNLIGVQTLNFQ